MCIALEHITQCVILSNFIFQFPEFLNAILWLTLCTTNHVKKKSEFFFLETSLNICQKITYSWCLCPNRHTSSKLKKLTNVRCPQIWRELPSVKMKIHSCIYRHGLLFIDNSGEIPVHESNKRLEILKMNPSYYQTLQE